MSPIVPPDPPLVDRDRGFALRPWAVGDADQLAAAWVDPEIARWCAVPADPSVEHAARWIEGWAKRLASCTALDLVIAGADGAVFGEVALRRLARPASSGAGSDAYELGWWLAPAHRGLGLAAAAVTTMVVWAIGRYPELHLVARIPAGHLASEHVAAAAGMRRRGRLDDGRILWTYET